MRYCPRCGAEYYDHVSECSDCGVPLVDESPADEDEPPSGAPLGDWDYAGHIPVRIVSTTIHAELIVAMLRAHGLRGFYAGTGLELWSEAGQIGQMTNLPGPLNEIRIMVHRDDEEDARDLLASIDAQERAEPPGDLAGARWSLDPVRRRRRVRAVALFYLWPILLAPGVLVWHAVTFVLDLLG